MKHAVEFATFRGNAIYYALDNRIELSSNVDTSKEFDICFNCDQKLHTFANKFIIELTQKCNMRCNYCCYSGSYKQMRKHSELVMSKTNIAKCIDFIYRNYNREAKEILVNFYGGEALICFEDIKYVVLQLRKNIGGIIHFSISTNGLLLTPKVIDWICSMAHIQVIVSIDGDKFLHDKNRKSIAGKGTYDCIIKNLAYFKNKYPEHFPRRVTILTTIRSIDEILYLDTVWPNTFLKEKYPDIVSTIVPNFSNNGIMTNFDCVDTFYAHALHSYIESKNNLMRRSIETLIQPLKERQFSTINNKFIVSTCLNSPYSYFISAEGFLYPCEKVSTELRIGDLDNGINSSQVTMLNQTYVNRLNRFCSQCWAIRLCQKCIACLNYSDDEFDRMCELKRNEILLSLKYYCITKDLQQIGIMPMH